MASSGESVLTEEIDALFKDIADVIYTNCYCEENVWHLCDAVRKKSTERFDNCYAVFISNLNQTIPLWSQKSSTSEEGCVIWDYHVIMIEKQRKGSEITSFVYDMDTTLEFPCLFSKYVVQAIRSCQMLKPNYRRLFRVVSGQEFLEVFASDRSHMLDDDNRWMKPPPSYPCIQTQDSQNNLENFVSMDVAVGVGTVMNLKEFWEFFYGSGSG